MIHRGLPGSSPQLILRSRGTVFGVRSVLQLGELIDKAKTCGVGQIKTGRLRTENYIRNLGIYELGWTKIIDVYSRKRPAR